MPPALLFLPYLPSVQWLTIAALQETLHVEQHENFVKSTSRNRARIATAQGLQILTIPIQGGRDHHQRYTDTEIASGNPWQKKHLHSLQTAYAAAPYFEHYMDRLLPFYTHPYQSLFRFNLAMLRELLELFGLPASIVLTTAYAINPEPYVDYRNEACWHQSDSFARYFQVFEDRHGFLPNLCALDLLFHLGPQAKDYLYQQTKKWK